MYSISIKCCNMVTEKKKRPQQMYFSKEIKLKILLDLHKYITKC